MRTFTANLVAETSVDLTSSGDDDYIVGSATVTVVGTANATSVDILNGTGLYIIHDGTGSGAEVFVGWRTATLFGAGAEYLRRRVVFALTAAISEDDQRVGVRFCDSSGAATNSVNHYVLEASGAERVGYNRNETSAKVAAPSGSPSHLELEWVGGYILGRYHVTPTAAIGDAGTVFGRTIPETLEADASSVYDYETDLVGFYMKNFGTSAYGAICTGLRAEVFI